MKNDSKIIYLFILILILLAIPVWAKGQAESSGTVSGKAGQKQTVTIEPIPDLETNYSAEGTETAVLAGGCFWGVEGVFEQLQGVLNVDSGYSGGDAETAHYQIVVTGATGHAEAVRIVYDPDKISYETILKVFFNVAHNPTELNYQGPDHGTQYRSAVFYLNDEQKKTTEDYIRKLEKEGIYSDEIVTEVAPLDAFYPAEDYHQDFLRLNPTYPYIVYWDLPKLEDLKMKYPELMAVK